MFTLGNENRENRRTDSNADANGKQMKRTITEIFIEVEETIAVRHTAKIGDAENELRPMNEAAICQHCGQTMIENKNLQQEEENKDES
jgi:hypothetical protein